MHGLLKSGRDPAADYMKYSAKSECTNANGVLVRWGTHPMCTWERDSSVHVYIAEIGRSKTVCLKLLDVVCN